MAERVSETIARHGMFSGGETVVVAVSGGPDSMCLLDVLGRLGAGLTLVVAHVDHGLSADSERISTDVAAHAAARGFDVHVARAKGLEGANLHARARDFRYGFFDAIAADVNAAKIATGHTLDDRIETTLARFIKGAGTDVLTGIPAMEAKRVRPLIDVRRAETIAYCDEVGLAYVSDPANDDIRFDRAAVRNLVLPAIVDRWGEGAVKAMATSVERLGEDSAALREAAERLFDGMVERTGDEVRFEVHAFGGLPRAYQRRLLEMAIGRVRDRSGGIDEALDALARTDRKVDARFAVADGREIVLGKTHVTVRRAVPNGAPSGDL
ncbi:MAG: tRNA lysidine(34) synthetase TilS [Actinomycetota bacterium]